MLDKLNSIKVNTVVDKIEKLYTETFSNLPEQSSAINFDHQQISFLKRV